MQVDMNPRFTGQLLKERRKMEPMLLRRARPIARRLAAQTPVRRRGLRRNPPPGTTKASVRIETGHLGAKRDRVAVRVVQAGAAVPLHWRHRRGHFARAI